MRGSASRRDELDTDVIYPVHLSTNTVGGAISVGTSPEWPTLTPNGKTLYTSNYLNNGATAGSLTPISTATNTAGSDITVGDGPGQLAIVPNQGPKAAFASSVSGLKARFNGAGSSDSDGTVAKYAWRFGDGHMATTTSPSTSHTYSKAGGYKVMLTVTDNEGCSTTQVFTGQTMYCNGSRAAGTSNTVRVT